jgi:hypothetical protein
MPLSSLTDDSRRTEVWSFIREQAALVDPARMTLDIQMIGLDITLTAKTGDTHQLLAKAQSLPGTTVALEDDDL